MDRSKEASRACTTRRGSRTATTARTTRDRTSGRGRGPATGSLDEAMSEGVIAPDPDTPSRTPRD